MNSAIKSQILPQTMKLPSHEQLSALAIADPVAFEQLRLELINSVIDGATERNKSRMLGIQFQVDAIRSLCKSNTSSTVKVYQLMWKSLGSLNQAWGDFQQLKANNNPEVDNDNIPLSSSANVLPFRHSES
jgi:hypothetical protein